MPDTTADVPQYSSALEFYRACLEKLNLDHKNQNHIGKLILNTFRTYPHRINQINADTGVRETNASVLNRTIATAQALRRYGLKVGDLVAIMGPNHLDLCVPFYACMYLGIAVMPVYSGSTEAELAPLLTTAKPSIVFCQTSDLSKLGPIREKVDFQMVTFDGPGDSALVNPMTMQIFNETLSIPEPAEMFQATDYVPEETAALVVRTSGTTGTPKCATLNYSSINAEIYAMWLKIKPFPFKDDVKIMLMLPLQWFSCQFMYIVSGLFSIPRVQTPRDCSVSKMKHIVNTFKPSITAIAPSLLADVLEIKESCDLTCFHKVTITGDTVMADLLQQFNEAAGRPAAQNVYGLTEAGGAVFMPVQDVPKSLGVPLPFVQCKLVDPETGNDVASDGTGELWIKSIIMFKGYYNAPEETAKAVTPDGYFKTGDLIKRDQNGHYWYVERMKSIFKYKYHQVSASQIEEVISSLPGVKQVGVTSLRNDGIGNLPVAVVVKEGGSGITAQDVKDIVKSKLSDASQLRGGVIFVSELPMTVNQKVDLCRLKQLAKTMSTE